MKVLVAYNGTRDARAALKYGIRKARQLGAGLIVLNVFPDHLFIDYDAGPKAEEFARRESLGRAEEALQLIRDNGGDLRARLIMIDGHEEDELLAYAGREDVHLIVAPPAFCSIAEKAVCLTDIVSADEEDSVELTERQEEFAGARAWRSN